MIKQDIAPLNRFLAKVKDASRSGLKEVRISTKDAVEISTLLALVLLEKVDQPVEYPVPVIGKSHTDGGSFKP